MPRVRKREAAKRDLVVQWVWYAENATMDIADRFLKAADDTAFMLAETARSWLSLFRSPSRTSRDAAFSRRGWL